MKQGRQGTLPQEILTLLESENGLRVVDISQRLKVTMDCISGHLRDLLSEGKVYYKPTKSGGTDNWYVANNYDRLWKVRPDNGVRYY